ncbi:hypothetical protein RHMOL_Rhmol05G0068200 [Rhododendron molle]|uniref:Uncharacterized protein n=1 Tax=Rhododendron molle TaxID=49168 RepID=A0ACC0NME9_RHOML|nr:hypothetical protein RHMOL_Rhmol05G0068200 [Rhododendron molle]
MKFEAVVAISRGVKHKIQKAKVGGGLVHIRCCNNEKYWTWGLTKDSFKFIAAQADQPREDTTTRACTLIKPSQYTKDGISVVNLQVMYEGTWWSISGDVSEGEDFIILDWESLLSNQPQGAFDGNKNTNTACGVTLGDATIEGGVFFGNANIGAPIMINTTIMNDIEPLATQIQEMMRQLQTLAIGGGGSTVNMNTEVG